MRGRWTIVTGGAGFIGHHLVDALVSRGELVRVIERPGAVVDHLPSSVEIARADIRDPTAVRKAMDGADWVYHLAADPCLWALDKTHFEAVNHQGAIHVMDAALEAGARRVLHVSTESILTRPGLAEAIDENVVVGVEDAVGPYCRSKLLAELNALERGRAGQPVVVANPTMPVGPGDRNLSPPSRLIRDFCQGRLPAYTECTLNLIDVRDVAEGLVRVMDRGRPARRHLLGACNLRLIELLTLLSRLTGVPCPRWRVPYPIALAVAHLSEFWADKVSATMPQATVTGVRLSRRLFHFDCARTLDELDLKPRAIEQSLKEMIDWMSLVGWIEAPRIPVVEHRRRTLSKADSTQSARRDLRHGIRFFRKN